MPANFDIYRQLEPTYRSNESTRKAISKKTIALVVGPSGIGKSTVMNRVTEIDTRFTRVSGFTSRPKRANDEIGLYRYIHTDSEFDWLDKQIETGNLVQYAVSPTQDVIYGTTSSDFEGKFCLQDTFASAVGNMKTIGFETCDVIGLIAQPETWEKWFTSRFDRHDPRSRHDALHRLNEAASSLIWLLNEDENGSIKWVENREGELDRSANELMGVVDGDSKQDTQTMVELATSMLDHIPTLLHQYE